MVTTLVVIYTTGAQPTPTIGTDCHITLTHPDVNGGEPYGFILSSMSPSRPEGIQVTRQVFSEVVSFYDTGMRVWIHFDILLADHMLNPDGSEHTQSRADMYSMLLNFLDQKDSISLTSAIGTFVNLGAPGLHRTRETLCSLFNPLLPAQQHRILLSTHRPHNTRSINLGWFANMGNLILAVTIATRSDT